MYDETVVFSPSLYSPPQIRHADISRNESTKQPIIYYGDYWGLDFYHCSGQIEFLDRGEMVRFQPGDVGIIGPNERIRVTDFTERDSLYISFNLSHTQENRVHFPTLFNLGDQYNPLQRMAREAVKSWNLEPKRAQAMVWAVLWELAQFQEKKNEGKAEIHRDIKDTAELIELEMVKDLSLSYLSEKVNLSPSRLSRLFHEQMGITLIKYIRKQRIDRACFLLKHTDLPIKEIAFRVGISDIQVFNKSFKKEMILSPTAYRSQKTS